MNPQLDGMKHVRPTSEPGLEGNVMLLHEALARSRMHEAQQAAAEWALARELTAGRRWEWLARFAERRAVRARAVAHREVGMSARGLRSAV
ncbi:hypothetical protein ACQEVB_13030 [Pseudonocardia sp. CA-107938]|uniref:hypothetical protein n=1 Tax=Pseudonocardia sp. CA-107938 TaxID=3240021 RepID=UPI003D8C204C